MAARGAVAEAFILRGLIGEVLIVDGASAEISTEFWSLVVVVGAVSTGAMAIEMLLSF